ASGGTLQSPVSGGAYHAAFCGIAPRRQAACGTKAASRRGRRIAGRGKPTHSPYNAPFTRNAFFAVPVKVFRGLPNAESRAPCALTIGNFDGVHRGHQSLLARARAAADARGLPLCVMTFEPHPREFFTPDKAPTRIALLR